MPDEHDPFLRSELFHAVRRVADLAARLEDLEVLQVASALSVGLYGPEAGSEDRPQLAALAAAAKGAQKPAAALPDFPCVGSPLGA